MPERFSISLRDVAYKATDPLRFEFYQYLKTCHHPGPALLIREAIDLLARPHFLRHRGDPEGLVKAAAIASVSTLLNHALHLCLSFGLDPREVFPSFQDSMLSREEAPHLNGAPDSLPMGEEFTEKFRKDSLSSDREPLPSRPQRQFPKTTDTHDFLDNL